MTEISTVRKLFDLQGSFIKRIGWMMVGYNDDRVVQSLKNKTHRKRAATSTEFMIHPKMKRTMSLKQFLSICLKDHDIYVRSGFVTVPSSWLSCMIPTSRATILKKIIHTKILIP